MYIPGHADEIMGKEDWQLLSSVDWLFLYLVMNSLQDSTRVKSLLQLVSNIAFTPNDLKKVVSFLKTWKIEITSDVNIQWQQVCSTNLLHTPKVNEQLLGFYKNLDLELTIHRREKQAATLYLTWSGEIPKYTASEALDWGDRETMTAFPLSILKRNSSKLCFSSITVSADVTHPLHSTENHRYYPICMGLQ